MTGSMSFPDKAASGMGMLRLMLVLGILMLNQHAFTQDQKITVSFQNADIESTLEKLSVLSGFLFSYNPDNLPKDSKVTAHYTDQSLNDILNDLLPPLQLGHHIMQNMVIITPEPKNPPSEKTSTTQTASTPPKKYTETEVNRRDSLVVVYDTIKVSRVVFDTVRTVIQERYYDTTTVSKYDLSVGSLSLAMDAGTVWPLQNNNEPEANLYRLDNQIQMATGLRLIYEKSKIGVSVGAAYTRLQLQSDQWTDSLYFYYEYDTVGSYYVIKNGEREYHYIMDSTEHQVHSSIRSTRSVNRHLFSVPIRISYRADIHRKLSIWMGGEAAVSFLTSQSSKPELAIESKTTTAFTYGCFLQLGYKLTFNAVFFLEERFTKMSGELAKDSYRDPAFLQTGLGFRLYF